MGRIIQMWRRASIALLFLFAAILGSSLGCKNQSGKKHTWEVVVVSLPENILLENIAEGAAGYLFRQTHEPLFRQEDGENFASRVLAGWSRNINCTEFKFCPDVSLKFDENTRFSPDLFQSFVIKVTSWYNGNFKVIREGDCSIIKFTERQPGYLYFLTNYKNSPSIIKEGVTYGLGAFSVKSISKSAIKLVRKEKIANGYNTVILNTYGGPEDQNLKSRRISDFNKLSSFQQPEWVKTEYMGFNNIELRVVGLGINHLDDRVRKVLYNCIDADEFRRAAIPARKDFYDIQTVLPIGVPGARGGKPWQSCVVPNWMKGETVVFANPRTDNQKQLSDYFNKFKQKTGIKIILKQYKPEEIDAMFSDKKNLRPYNLLMIVTANSTPDQDGFFEFYVGKDCAIDHVPVDIKRQYFELKRENYPIGKKELAEKLAKELGAQGLVLPLYQTFVRLYYPPNIKNLSVGRGFTETPDIADLRW